MKQFFNIKNIVILLSITLVMVIISLVYRPTKPLPQIISTSPATNSTKVNYFDSVLLKFDQPIESSLLTATSVPEELWDFSTTEGDLTTIVLNHAQYFRVNTDYSLTIFYDNQQIHVLKFKTAPQQNDPRYVQAVNNELARDYPLATKVPYENNVFKIIYSAPMTLEITLKNPNLTSAEVIEEVKSWVTENGGDVASHKYIITTTNP